MRHARGERPDQQSENANPATSTGTWAWRLAGAQPGAGALAAHLLAVPLKAKRTGSALLTTEDQAIEGDMLRKQERGSGRADGGLLLPAGATGATGSTHEAMRGQLKAFQAPSRSPRPPA